MNDLSPTSSTRASLATPIIWGLTALYVVVAIIVMWYAPRVPYADGWRFLGHFLTTPFPSNVFAPDNGHHEIIPNAVRVAELQFFHAGQWLQVCIGIVFALATAVLAWRTLRSLSTPAQRAAAMLFAVLGLFWLGNVRALGHANESVHAYAVTLCLAIGLGLLSRQDEAGIGLKEAIVASLCGLVAAFSFGSGIASFAAFFIVAGLRRAPAKTHVVLACGLLVTLALLHLSGGNDASTLRLALGAQADRLLRWLAGPAVYVAWPVLDPALASQLPIAPVRKFTESFAQGYQASFGPVMLARWPHVLLAVFGLAWLALSTLRARFAPLPAALFGVGLAWFAVAVGAMIVLVRLNYFLDHPDQLLAPRYVVWSSLFWSGLGIATVAYMRPVRAAVLAMLCAIVLLPSEVWMAKLGAGMWRVADQTAVAAVVGVLDPELATGETVPDELVQALPAIRTARTAVFAWPETQWLGRAPAADALRLQNVHEMRVDGVSNRLGTPGRRVRFNIDDASAQRLLLIDADGIARGIAIRDTATETGWIGWMQQGRAGAPRVAALIRQD
ncbi:hypothetical protein [Luteimonas panaciterrae]|uniref:hypothetical protein n=1 Tax=Luteimonas panaciterrae TaxID=363885 RepID=UPI001CF92FE0|nr:hypothetical protein [Luteimonas panaciterrae]